jgi:hypothetical protein
MHLPMHKFFITAVCPHNIFQLTNRRCLRGQLSIHDAAQQGRSDVVQNWIALDRVQVNAKDSRSSIILYF